MIRTQNICLSSKDLPAEWCFKYLLGINYDLGGGDIKILSPLSSEKTASFCLYKNKYGNYKFKCFSSSCSGDHVDLLIQLQAQKGITLTRKMALNSLKVAFKEFLSTGEYVSTESRQILNGKGKVTDFELRRWKESPDIEFWGECEIDIPSLEHYNVAPLLTFTIEKLKNGKIEKYVFTHDKMYGYFRKDGSLYTIYCPDKKPKFVRVGNGYLLGTDQIIKPARFLIYIKSLKDGIAFKKMGFEQYDFKVPDSETTIVPKEQVEKDKKTYEKVFVWLDPDRAGNLMAEKYKEIYDLDRINFELGPKDLTDGIKAHGGIIAKLNLLQLL